MLRVLHASAAKRLANKRGPVLTINLVKGGWTLPSQMITAPSGVATNTRWIRPHRSAVLLGDPQVHHYSCISITEHASGKAAHDALIEQPPPTESMTLWGVPSATFASLSDGGDVFDESKLPSRDVSESPYLAEASEQSPLCVHAWEDLQAEPSRPMLAFNLIRTPDAAAYKEFSSHFSELPKRYGMRFLSVAALDPDPNVSLLTGHQPLGLERGRHAGDAGVFSRVLAAVGLDARDTSYPEDGSFDLFALVYFPSTAAFIQAWSDPDIQRAFPLRAPMRAAGFRHVWLRCEEDGGVEE